MPSTLGSPFQSAGFSVERNEIISISQPLVSDRFISDGVTTSYPLTNFADTQLVDLQPFRVFSIAIDGSQTELKLDNIEGTSTNHLTDPSLFVNGGQYYFDPDVGLHGTIFLKRSVATGKTIAIFYYTNTDAYQHLEDGVLQQLATDLVLHPYGNDFSQTYSSLQQKTQTLTFNYNSGDGTGVGDSGSATFGGSVEFTGNDVGKRLREMNGSGIWTISQVSSGVASVTVLTAPNDSLYLPASSVTGEAVGTANGDTTRFTLTTSHKNRAVTVNIDGSAVDASTYVLSGTNTLIFNTAPASGTITVDIAARSDIIYPTSTWAMVIPSTDVEVQPYSLIYPYTTTGSSPITPDPNSGQQNQTDVMDAIRRIGSVFVVESEKATDILSSLKDVNSSSASKIIPTDTTLSSAKRGKRGPQKWRIKFSYDVVTGYLNVNVGTNLQIGDDGELSKIQGQDGLSSAVIRTPGELSNVYYKFDRKENKSKSGWFRRATKTAEDRQGTYPLTYRLTCTDHGTGLFIFDHASVDQDDDYAWFVVQRHANNVSGKIALEDGKSPVHCIYCPSKVPLEAGNYNFGYYGSYNRNLSASGTTSIDTTGLSDIFDVSGAKLQSNLATEVTIVTDKNLVRGGLYGRGASYLTPSNTYTSVVTGNDNNLNPINGNIANDSVGLSGYKLDSEFTGGAVTSEIGPTDFSTYVDMLKFSQDTSGNLAPTGHAIGAITTDPSATVSQLSSDALLAGKTRTTQFNTDNTLEPPRTANTLEDASRPEQYFYPFSEFPNDATVSNLGSNYWVPKRLELLNKSKEERLGPAESGLGIASISVTPLLGNNVGFSNIQLIENTDYQIREEGGTHFFEWLAPLPNPEVANLNVIEEYTGADLSSNAITTTQEAWQYIYEGVHKFSDGTTVTPYGKTIDDDVAGTTTTGYKGVEPSVTVDGVAQTKGTDYVLTFSGSTGVQEKAIITFQAGKIPTASQKIVVKVPVNPMNVSVQLSYSWDGAGYNGVYKNVYGRTSDTPPTHRGEDRIPLQSLSKLDVYVGNEIDAALFPEEYNIDSNGFVQFTATSRTGVYVYSMPQDKIYINGGAPQGTQVRFSYEQYNTERSDGGVDTYLIKTPVDREMPLSSSIEEMAKQKAIYRFCVREADVFKPWDIHVSAIVSQTDSPALINPMEQLSISPDKTFVFNFPGPMTTQRYIYPNTEMDLICFSSANSSALGGFTSITSKYDLDNGTVTTIDDGTPASNNGGVSSNGDTLNFRDVYSWSTGTDSATTSNGRTYAGLAATQPFGNGMRLFMLVRGGPIRPEYTDFQV